MDERMCERMGVTFVCPESWNPVYEGEYIGKDSYFGGESPLSKAVGYIVVIGFGAFFSLFTTLVVYIEKLFSGNATSQANTSSEYCALGVRRGLGVFQVELHGLS